MKWLQAGLGQLGVGDQHLDSAVDLIEDPVSRRLVSMLARNTAALRPWPSNRPLSRLAVSRVAGVGRVDKYTVAAGLLVPADADRPLAFQSSPSAGVSDTGGLVWN